MRFLWREVKWTDVAIVLFTGVLTWLAVLQHQILRETVELTRNDQRALVGAVNPTGTLTVGQPVAFSVSIRNFGNGPALDVVNTVHLKMAPSDQPFTSDAPGAGSAASHSVLWPNAELVAGVGEAPVLSKETAHAIVSGKLSAYGFGEITYKDAFGRPHRTTFAYAALPSGKTWRVLDAYNTAN
jgi:hypothetical protein